MTTYPFDILVTRRWFTERSTTSIVSGWTPGNAQLIDLGYFLEDVARPDGVKIPKLTAIPSGDYKVIVNMSNRFKKLMPLIYNDDTDLSVKCGKFKFEGVRMHSGNTAEDTEACLLSGKTKAHDMVLESRNQFNDVLFPFIQNHPSLKALGYLRLRIINDQQI